MADSTIYVILAAALGVVFSVFYGLALRRRQRWEQALARLAQELPGTHSPGRRQGLAYAFGRLEASVDGRPVTLEKERRLVGGHASSNSRSRELAALSTFTQSSKPQFLGPAAQQRFEVQPNEQGVLPEVYELVIGGQPILLIDVPPRLQHALQTDPTVAGLFTQLFGMSGHVTFGNPEMHWADTLGVSAPDLRERVTLSSRVAAIIETMC